MRTKTCVAAVLVVAACAVPTVTSAGRPHPYASPVAAAPAPPQELAEGDPAFYMAPDPIPAGTHGDLIRFQLADDSGRFRIFRIMYLSETIAGAPTVVTGLVMVPGGLAPFGGFRMLLDGHGSTGLADRCAPSQNVETQPIPLGIDVYSSNAESFVIASTDFEGLGGPGSHPLLVGISAGRGMLDSGRAARQLPGIYVGNETGILGFSEGGHAALWATQLAAEWTPEQPIFGSVIASPASEVVQLVHDSVGNPDFEALAAGIVAGLAVAYPEAQAARGSVLTTSGQELITGWNEQCFYESVTTSGGAFLSTDPTTTEPFASLLAANVAGAFATPTPLLVLHSSEDERIPVAQSEVLLARLCGLGQVVERRVVSGSHASSAVAAAREGVDWLVGLAGGTPPTSTCGG